MNEDLNVTGSSQVDTNPFTPNSKDERGNGLMSGSLSENLITSMTVVGSSDHFLSFTSSLSKRTISSSKDKGKGLREFSWRVCMKVEEKGCTSYNEVADELVREMSYDSPTYDQKNIRRRVYDALNVLMAIGVITKDKKLIRWIGLPSGARQEINELEREKRELNEAIALKRRIISERLRNEVAIRRLILRNKTLDSQGLLTNRATVKLPFLLLHVHKDAVINGYVTKEGRVLYIRFDKPFQIHDDADLMRLMKLYQAPLPELHALISEDFRPFITDEFYETS